MAVVGAVASGIGGAVVAAYALVSSFRAEMNRAERSDGERLLRLELHVGVDRNGAITGNGLLARVKDVERCGFHAARGAPAKHLGGDHA